MNWVLISAIAGWVAAFVSLLGLAIAFRQLRQGLRDETERYINLQIDASIGRHLLSITDLSDRARRLLDDSRGAIDSALQEHDNASEISAELARHTEQASTYIKEIRAEKEKATEVADQLIALLGGTLHHRELEIEATRAYLARLREETRQSPLRMDDTRDQNYQNTQLTNQLKSEIIAVERRLEAMEVEYTRFVTDLSNLRRRRLADLALPLLFGGETARVEPTENE